MARTLADMTPEERQSCVGMWANIASRNALFIIDSVYSETALIFSPGESFDADLMDLNFILPQLGLPRAWNPDGAPVVMRQEWAARLESGGASITSTRAEAEQAHARHREQYENYGTGSYDMLEPPPPAPAGIQHRFTTEWEATNE